MPFLVAFFSVTGLPTTIESNLVAGSEKGKKNLGKEKRVRRALGGMIFRFLNFGFSSPSNGV